MTRFSGVIGYGMEVETPPYSGKWVKTVIERKLRGDVVRNTKQDVVADQLNDNLSVSNSISVVADPFALANFNNIIYVMWNGVRWKVREVDVQRPRLILSLGVVYNGPTPV